ncbi:MAG: DedA family protein [Planctomycetes bacterium]|nr:DedA family protein [Planctomycetota bacterium]
MDAILETLQQSPGLWAFGFLLFCGLGLPPWSEEIVILACGYFVATGDLTFGAAVMWCWAGILAGDSLIYLLGKVVGESVYDWPILRRHMGMKQQARFQRRFRKEGDKAIFFARFIPGYRMVAYFVAGNRGMAYWRFVAIDSLGALLTVPISIWFGKVFADNLNDALELLDEFKVPLGITGLIVLGLLFWRSMRQRKLRLREILQIRSLRRQKTKEVDPNDPE